MSKCFFEISINNEVQGKIVFNLFDDVVPKTAKNFRELCKKTKPEGYNKSIFHRIIPGFMAQGGDFTREDGTGGRSIYGNKFDDENFTKKHDKKYLLSMANCGKNTNGSQFFITFEKTEWLDNQHVVFGEVVEGEDIVKSMEKQGSPSGRVKVRVQISDCGVLEE